jgi:hypothetical protein
MNLLARSAAVLGLVALTLAPTLAVAPLATAAEASKGPQKGPEGPEPLRVPSSSVATHFGDAQFEPGRSAIVVPYTGAAPQPTLYTISGAHHYYEFPSSRLAKPAVQFRRVGGAIERYTVADRAYGAVRVSFKLTQAATPTVQVDSARHQVVIWPLGKAVRAGAPAAAMPSPSPKAVPTAKPSAQPKAQATPAAKPTARPTAKPTPKPAASKRPAAPRASAAPQSALPSHGVRVPNRLTPPTQKYALKTEVGKPYFDDFHHRLVLPYKGQEPDFTVVVYYKNPRWVYFDFNNAYITVEGERFETFLADSAFEGWMLSQRKGGLKTRLYLKLKSPGQVVAQVHDESRQIWLEVPGRTPAKAPAATPAGATPEPNGPAKPEPNGPAKPDAPSPAHEPDADAEPAPTDD